MYYVLPVAAVLVAASLALVLGHRGGARVGQPYLRQAHESLVVLRAVFSDSAANPLARALVMRMLSRPLMIQIEHTGQCSTIRARYELVSVQLRMSASPLEQAFKAARPVALFDSTSNRCCAYTVTYQLPLSRPMQYRRRMLTTVPLRLNLIHQRDDFRLFRTVNEDQTHLYRCVGAISDCVCIRASAGRESNHAPCGDADRQ